MLPEYEVYMVEGWSRVERLADSPDHVVPGHDPQVLRRFAVPSDALEGSVAAVHLDRR